jgi:hypothetical protein
MMGVSPFSLPVLSFVFLGASSVIGPLVVSECSRHFLRLAADAAKVCLSTVVGEVGVALLVWLIWLLLA